MGYYIAVKWEHDFNNEPATLFAELDEDRYEARKVDVWRNGETTYADSERQSGNTYLAAYPVPTVEEILLSPEFEPRQITENEFETIWRNAISQRAL